MGSRALMELPCCMPMTRCYYITETTLNLRNNQQTIKYNLNQLLVHTFDQHVSGLQPFPKDPHTHH
jgi:hypothetical protein